MDYSPINPVVWMLFFGGLALVYLSVSVYHRIYPYYPGEAETVEEPLLTSDKVLAPTNTSPSDEDLSNARVYESKKTI